MLRILSGRKDAEMHRIAVERLRRAQLATAEGRRIRVERGLEQLDAWDAGPDEKNAPPTSKDKVERDDETREEKNESRLS